MRKTILGIAIVLFTAVFAQGATIYVPADYAAIQAAINAASNGDVIFVSIGTYTENINFIGKNITLTSIDPNAWLARADRLRTRLRLTPLTEESLHEAKKVGRP